MDKVWDASRECDSLRNYRYVIGETVQLKRRLECHAKDSSFDPAGSRGQAGKCHAQISEFGWWLWLWPDVLGGRLEAAVP